MTTAKQRCVFCFVGFLLRAAVLLLATGGQQCHHAWSQARAPGSGRVHPACLPAGPPTGNISVLRTAQGWVSLRAGAAFELNRSSHCCVILGLPSDSQTRVRSVSVYLCLGQLSLGPLPGISGRHDLQLQGAAHSCVTGGTWFGKKATDPLCLLPRPFWRLLAT